jgi:hypothetical protein
MVKFAGNRGAAFLFARIVFVCALFAIGLAPVARADTYQYTVAFDSLNSTGLYTSFSFDTTSLLGSASVSIDPSDVHVIAAPHEGFNVTNEIQNLTVSSNSFAVTWLAIIGPVSAGCLGSFTNWNCYNSIANGSFLNPITSPGTYQFDSISMGDHLIGGGQLLEYNPGNSPSLEGKVSLMVTPEPNSGLMFGGCVLLCAAVALRRRTRVQWRATPVS